jgi:hypothetical protein
MNIESLYTLCIERDIDVWKYSSRKILEMIYSDEYNLIVPDNQVNIFKRNTPSEFIIIPESSINKNISLQSIRDLLPIALKPWAGWYFQQILKIEAIIKTNKNNTVIWDSDTIPLCNINFLNSNDIYNYYVGEEFHEEYFLTNKKLINIDKQVNFSFIAQCFPVCNEDIRRMIADIEGKHNKVWYEAMISCVEGGVIQGFSEYELMGSYLFKNSKEKMNFLEDRRWSRDGKKIFKCYQNLNDDNLRNLSKKFDFIAIEGGLDKNLINFYSKKIINNLCKILRAN